MNTPSRPKFEIHLNDFYPEDREYAKEYECFVCQKVSPNNYCLSCSHCICSYCIKYKNIEKCQIHNEIAIVKNLTTFRNKLIGEALLNNLKMKCIFYQEGCMWCGFFKNFKAKHLPICKIYLKYKLKEKSINNDKEDNNNSGNDNTLQKDLLEEEKSNINEKKNYLEKEINEDYNYDDKYIDNEIAINNYQCENNYLNKKRKNSIDIEKYNNDNSSFSSSDFRKSEKDKFSIEIKENQSSSHYINIDSFDKEMLLSEDNDLDSNYNSFQSENSSSYENYEQMNNQILIDSNLTLNIFPYYYYFTEPLYYSFTCLIKTIKRNILKDEEEISFGLTNMDNNEYSEIISTKNDKWKIFKGDLYRISYDNNLFLVYLENDKNNCIKIPFKFNENIKYYPTIILNNIDDIIQVSHD